MTIGAQRRGPAAQSPDAAPLRMVTLSMIADRDYLALARTTAMHVGALLSFPLAQVADLRLAVNEACACFLDTAVRRAPDAFGPPAAAHAPAAHAPVMAQAPAPAWLELSYDRYPDELHVTVRAPADEGWPEVDDLGWEVLSALVSDVHWYVHDGLGVLTLVQPLPEGD